MIQDGTLLPCTVGNKEWRRNNLYHSPLFKMSENFLVSQFVIHNDGELTCITLSDTECQRTYLYHIKWYRMLEDLFVSHLVIQNDGGLTCITVRSRPSWGTLTSIRTCRIKTSAIYARVVVALVNIYNERNSVYFFVCINNGYSLNLIWLSCKCSK